MLCYLLWNIYVKAIINIKKQNNKYNVNIVLNYYTGSENCTDEEYLLSWKNTCYTS